MIHSNILHLFMLYVIPNMMKYIATVISYNVDDFQGF